MTGRSQLEVCGAAIMTHLGTSGNLPSMRHPKILRNNEAVRRSAELNMGVSKIVYCILSETWFMKTNHPSALLHAQDSRRNVNNAKARKNLPEGCGLEELIREALKHL